MFFFSLSCDDIGQRKKKNQFCGHSSPDTSINQSKCWWHKPDVDGVRMVIAHTDK